MTIHVPSGHLEILSRLQRTVGVHMWTLDLDHGVFQFEIGQNTDSGTCRSLPLEILRSLLAPEEMQIVAAHWREAALSGIAGPALLPFVKADGARSQVESACCLLRDGQTNSLLGVFRRPSVIVSNQQEIGMHKERLLVEYVEAFIDNSPSAIVVASPGGSIISINQECLRFLGKSHRSEVLRKSLHEILRAIDIGLGDIVAQVMGSTKPMRGRYDVQLGHGKRHTLYWRFFALSGSFSTSPPKVFAFDVNSGGPRAGSPQ
ncbi:MAG: hypothetical protein FD175_769 [Beijerinckiaceae bacterium]|nr:MAG: hypothetical protein FD175_769 [Beijerinckiaceae bacterium]